MKRIIEKGKNNKSGVYKITNLINNKFYIGSTKNLSSRYRTHLSSLTLNKSGCVILQNAVNKYGIENFKFEVLFIGENYFEKEIEFIKILKPPYNSILETLQKRIVSEETKKKQSISQIERYKLYPAKRGYKKPNYKRESRFEIILSKSDEILKFDSAEETAKYFNTCKQAVFNAITNKCKYKGYNIIKQLKE